MDGRDLSLPLHTQIRKRARNIAASAVAGETLQHERVTLGHFNYEVALDAPTESVIVGANVCRIGGSTKDAHHGSKIKVEAGSVAHLPIVVPLQNEVRRHVGNLELLPAGVVLVADDAVQVRREGDVTADLLLRVLDREGPPEAFRRRMRDSDLWVAAPNHACYIVRVDDLGCGDIARPWSNTQFQGCHEGKRLAARNFPVTRLPVEKCLPQAEAIARTGDSDVSWVG